MQQPGQGEQDQQSGAPQPQQSALMQTADHHVSMASHLVAASNALTGARMRLKKELEAREYTFQMNWPTTDEYQTATGVVQKRLMELTHCRSWWAWTSLRRHDEIGWGSDLQPRFGVKPEMHYTPGRHLLGLSTYEDGRHYDWKMDFQATAGFPSRLGTTPDASELMRQVSERLGHYRAYLEHQEAKRDHLLGLRRRGPGRAQVLNAEHRAKSLQALFDSLQATAGALDAAVAKIATRAVVPRRHDSTRHGLGFHWHDNKHDQTHENVYVPELDGDVEHNPVYRVYVVMEDPDTHTVIELYHHFAMRRQYNVHVGLENSQTIEFINRMLPLGNAGWFELVVTAGERSHKVVLTPWERPSTTWVAPFSMMAVNSPVFRGVQSREPFEFRSERPDDFEIKYYEPFLIHGKGNELDGMVHSLRVLDKLEDRSLAQRMLDFAAQFQTNWTPPDIAKVMRAYYSTDDARVGNLGSFGDRSIYFLSVQGCILGVEMSSPSLPPSVNYLRHSQVPHLPPNVQHAGAHGQQRARHHQDHRGHQNGGHHNGGHHNGGHHNGGHQHWGQQHWGQDQGNQASWNPSPPQQSVIVMPPPPPAPAQIDPAVLAMMNRLEDLIKAAEQRAQANPASAQQALHDVDRKVEQIQQVIADTSNQQRGALVIRTQGQSQHGQSHGREHRAPWPAFPQAPPAAHVVMQKREDALSVQRGVNAMHENDPTDGRGIAVVANSPKFVPKIVVADNLPNLDDPSKPPFKGLEFALDETEYNAHGGMLYKNDASGIAVHQEVVWPFGSAEQIYVWAVQYKDPVLRILKNENINVLSSVSEFRTPEVPAKNVYTGVRFQAKSLQDTVKFNESSNRDVMVTFKRKDNGFEALREPRCKIPDNKEVPVPVRGRAGARYHLQLFPEFGSVPGTDRYGMLPEAIQLKATVQYVTENDTNIKTWNFESSMRVVDNEIPKYKGNLTDLGNLDGPRELELTRHWDDNHNVFVWGLTISKVPSAFVSFAKKIALGVRGEYKDQKLMIVHDKSTWSFHRDASLRKIRQLECDVSFTPAPNTTYMMRLPNTVAVRLTKEELEEANDATVLSKMRFEEVSNRFNGVGRKWEDVIKGILTDLHDKNRMARYYMHLFAANHMNELNFQLSRQHNGSIIRVNVFNAPKVITMHHKYLNGPQTKLYYHPDTYTFGLVDLQGPVYMSLDGRFLIAPHIHHLNGESVATWGLFEWQVTSNSYDIFAFKASGEYTYLFNNVERRPRDSQGRFIKDNEWCFLRQFDGKLLNDEEIEKNTQTKLDIVPVLHRTNTMNQLQLTPRYPDHSLPSLGKTTEMGAMLETHLEAGNEAGDDDDNDEFQMRPAWQQGGGKKQSAESKPKDYEYDVGDDVFRSEFDTPSNQARSNDTQDEDMVVGGAKKSAVTKPLVTVTNLPSKKSEATKKQSWADEVEDDPSPGPPPNSWQKRPKLVQDDRKVDSAPQPHPKPLPLPVPPNRHFVDPVQPVEDILDDENVEGLRVMRPYLHDTPWSFIMMRFMLHISSREKVARASPYDPRWVAGSSGATLPQARSQGDGATPQARSQEDIEKERKLRMIEKAEEEKKIEETRRKAREEQEEKMRDKREIVDPKALLLTEQVRALQNRDEELKLDADEEMLRKLQSNFKQNELPFCFNATMLGRSCFFKLVHPYKLEYKCEEQKLLIKPMLTRGFKQYEDGLYVWRLLQYDNADREVVLAVKNVTPIILFNLIQNRKEANLWKWKRKDFPAPTDDLSDEEVVSSKKVWYHTIDLRLGDEFDPAFEYLRLVPKYRLTMKNELGAQPSCGRLFWDCEQRSAETIVYNIAQSVWDLKILENEYEKMFECPSTLLVKPNDSRTFKMDPLLLLYNIKEKGYFHIVFTKTGKPTWISEQITVRKDADNKNIDYSLQPVLEFKIKQGKNEWQVWAKISYNRSSNTPVVREYLILKADPQIKKREFGLVNSGELEMPNKNKNKLGKIVYEPADLAKQERNFKRFSWKIMLSRRDYNEMHHGLQAALVDWFSIFGSDCPGMEEVNGYKSQDVSNDEFFIGSHEGLERFMSLTVKDVAENGYEVGRDLNTYKDEGDNVEQRKYIASAQRDEDHYMLMQCFDADSLLEPGPALRETSRLPVPLLDREPEPERLSQQQEPERLPLQPRKLFAPLRTFAEWAPSWRT